MWLRFVVAACVLIALFQLARPAQAQCAGGVCGIAGANPFFGAAQAQFGLMAPQGLQAVQPGQVSPQPGQLFLQQPDLFATNIRALADVDRTIELRPGDTVIWETAPGQTHSVVFLPFGTGQELNFGHVEQVLDFGEDRDKLTVESSGRAYTQASPGELLRATVREDAPGTIPELQFWCGVHLSFGMTKRIAVAEEAPPDDAEPKTIRFRGNGVTWLVEADGQPPPPPPPVPAPGMAMMCPCMQMMGSMMGGGMMGMMGGQGMGGGMGMMGGGPGMGGGMGMMGGQGMGMMRPNLPIGLTPMPNAPTGLAPMSNGASPASGDMGMGSTPRPPVTPGDTQTRQ
jgi:plastocyanin